ncbi:MAG: hypothetical protein J2P49_11350, partial [Methylocapsa sp.]|nr:hypothetical protein [Methylocapsa sp.]
MKAVEHLKTLCCLGLGPESAMISVTPLLHEIIPHGWIRMALLRPDATLGMGYAEHPAAASFREHMWRFRNDPTSPMALWAPCFRAVGIGWTQHLQGPGWRERAWYREIEQPLDSCWILDAMIGEEGQAYAIVSLTRPRCAAPFTTEDVARFDRLRPWLAHAFRPQNFGQVRKGQARLRAAGAPVCSAQIVLSGDEKILFQTPELPFFLRALANEPGSHASLFPAREILPAPLQILIRRLPGTAKEASCKPPYGRISTPYGIVTLEAKWMMPAGVLAADAARDPKACLIAVTAELHEHAIAYAARVLRKYGATPSQMKVGIQLALGKTRSAIAEDLGLKVATVADQTAKLYQTLDVHNPAELAAKIWLSGDYREAPQAHVPRRPAPAARGRTKAAAASVIASATQAGLLLAENLEEPAQLLSA